MSQPEFSRNHNLQPFTEDEGAESPATSTPAQHGEPSNAPLIASTNHPRTLTSKDANLFWKLLRNHEERLKEVEQQRDNEEDEKAALRTKVDDLERNLAETKAELHVLKDERRRGRAVPAPRQHAPPAGAGARGRGTGSLRGGHGLATPRADVIIRAHLPETRAASSSAMVRYDLRSGSKPTAHEKAGKTASLLSIN
ncbi:hypothetical protein HDU93_005348 [Gonapodya sp. JEL0774]|nr:hypothetical protein HDU93_005348 [Gonapodya sp. JEL0774]